MTPEQRARIAEVIGTLTGLQTVWRDRQRPFVAPGTRAIILLSETSYDNVGALDETRFDYDPERPCGEEIRETINAVRAFSVTILCESYEQTDAGDATAYIEPLRVNLSRRTIKEALREVGLVVESTTATVDLSIPRDNRQTSIKAFDLRLRSVATAEDRVGYIDDVDLTAEVS